MPGPQLDPSDATDGADSRGPETNWAGNHAYTAGRYVRARSVEEAQEVVRSSPHVRLLGTRGTYVTDAGTHRLEGVDIFSDQEGAVIIQGRWRFRPGSPDEQTGNFRWVVGEDGREFKGTPNDLVWAEKWQAKL